MAHRHDHQREGNTPAHSHNCGGLFGCGDEQGTGVVREDIKDGAFDRRTADRLLHMDEVEQGRLDGFLSARGRARRQLLRASSFMSALAAVGPWFGKLAEAAGAGDTAPPSTGGGGRVRPRGGGRAACAGGGRGGLAPGREAARRGDLRGVGRRAIGAGLGLVGISAALGNK